MTSNDLLTRDAILRAIEDFDSRNSDEDFFKSHRVRRAESYFIRHDGREYDLKAIVRVARGYVSGPEAIRGPLENSKPLSRRLESEEFRFETVHYEETYEPTTKEGREKWNTQKGVERNRRLANKVMDRNRAQHGGWITCEACGFQDRKRSMFDAHHLEPLACGERDSEPSDLAVLCPTCHRWAHAKAGDRLHPLPVAEICKARDSG